MIKELVYYGDARLRQKCAPVEEITDEIRQYAQDLVDTCIDGDGAGLAGPQIGIMYRMFVCCFYTSGDKEGEYSIEDPIVCINPKLSEPSEELHPWPQGCLSIPEVYADVVRPNGIILEWTDLDGNQQSRELHGINATIAMHENDHINGVLFIDRLPQKERRSLEPLLRKVKKKYYEARKKK